MSNIITVGIIAEGSTDYRFLGGIIRRTFETVAMECATDIDVYSVDPIEVNKTAITDYVFNAAKRADEHGIMVMCVHVDADAETDKDAFADRINPAFDRVQIDKTADLCRNLVPVVPVRMVEAWMLGDKIALKQEMNTTLTDTELGIDRPPERIADPKACIEEAIRHSQKHKTRRHRYELTIGDLYEPLGINAQIAQLVLLPSFKKFQEAVRDAFRELGYLH
ncbi:DUF4276 family protein [Spirosoma sp. HMF3257]|uniref:DUF4276 family protein n=1 Tax=Spirosoma telluris TaxID=2183553 RepID=A0A327NKA9_9BACT|nr:DUF4276 family protein [Spirosoma telluris]RAI72978.1 hypothetical protein HMF3257_38285 [Spirosoma telluris]